MHTTNTVLHFMLKLSNNRDMKKTVKNRNRLTAPWRPSQKELLFVSGILMVTLFVFVSQVRLPQNLRSSAQTITNCTPAPADETIDNEEQKMLTLVNEYRQREGAEPLKLSKTLTRAATWMSTDINTTKSLSHTDSSNRDFVARIAQCGYDGNSSAENISNLGSADAVLKAWTASVPHNTNLLSTLFTVVGIARAGQFWTLDFGSNLGTDDSELGPNPSSAPAPSTVAPTFGVIVPCTNCTAPTQPVQQPQPSVIVPETSEAPETPDQGENPAPSASPEPDESTPPNLDQNGFIGFILEFLKKLLEFLQSLFGN
jgi:uncharacterized protein YkwD